MLFLLIKLIYFFLITIYQVLKIKQMSYHCKVTDTSITCGYGYHNRNPDKYFDNNYNFIITFDSNVMKVKYTLERKKWTILDYPFVSYKIHCLSCLKNLYLIELEIEEFDKNRLVFLLDVVSTPPGVKGPHYNGPVLQYFYLNKQLVIEKQVSSYDCKHLTNIYDWFERNKEKILEKKSTNYYKYYGVRNTLDTSFNILKLNKNYYLVISSVFYFLIDTTFEDDDYCEQVYWILSYSSHSLHRGYLIELLSDNFKPKKLDLCKDFVIEPISVQLAYYESVLPSYKFFNFY